MADKIKPGIAVRTTFVDGESPKAAKLNSLSSQLQNASQRLEQVVGDIHSESYPYSTLSSAQLSLEFGRQKTTSGALSGAPTRALDIATLGRLIGPASNLNPHQIGSQSITETVPTGVYEFGLEYPCEDSSDLVFSDTAVFATLRGSVALLDAAGDYYVDSLGKVYSVSETNGGTVTYTYNPRLYAGGNSYQDSSFNVIPDVNQLALGSGCSIGSLDANGRRPVVLPLATHHHYNTNGDSVILTATDPLYNQQLYLPKILIDNWSLEEEIPGGFLYLKNYTKNKIYKNATYYYYSSNSILIGGEDITDDVNAGDVFCIITVGTDITTSIEDLRRKLRHSHNRSFGESLVPVEALVGILSAAGNSGSFVPSEIPGNHFAQYLHRDGFTSGTDANRNDENIIRGDLAIGVSGANAGTHRTSTGPSYKLRFWGSSGVARPYIYRDVDDGFVFDADQTTAGSYYTNCDTEGVRIRNGVLIPEEGIASGLNITMGALSGEYNIKSLALKISDTFTTSSSDTIDLTSYGLDATKHKLVNAIVNINIPGVYGLISNNGGPIPFSNFDISWAMSDDTHPTTPYQLYIDWVGSAWGGSVNLDVCVVVYFTEI